MQVSPQLISQHFTTKLVRDYFLNHDHTDRWRNIRYQDLKIEVWFNCLWTNYGFISYRNFADYLLTISDFKGYQLPVEKINDLTYKVKGVRKPWYIVHDGKCECALYRQRVKRWNELPQLFKWFDRPFCHHTEAVNIYTNN